MLLLEEEEEEEALIDEAITQLQQTINNTAAVLGFLAQPPNYPRILSNSLLPVSESAFRHFYLNAEPGSFEKYLRFDRATFGDILERIRDLYSVITVRARYARVWSVTGWFIVRYEGFAAMYAHREWGICLCVTSW